MKRTNVTHPWFAETFTVSISSGPAAIFFTNSPLLFDLVVKIQGSPKLFNWALWIYMMQSLSTSAFTIKLQLTAQAIICFNC